MFSRLTINVDERATLVQNLKILSEAFICENFKILRVKSHARNALIMRLLLINMLI